MHRITMEIINNNTVVVFNSSELKSAIESANYNYIYFGENITLTSGININTTKTNLTIDGTYNNIRHTYTDMKSTAASNTINVRINNTNIIVKNMDITSYNYYGIIYVPEGTAYNNVTVEYNNIKYLGPQISFNPSGLTRFIDSNITVQENYSAGNEVAECNKIEIGGNTTIVHNSTASSSFWFRNSDPYFKILENSNVSFTSTNRELIYGVNNLEFTISKNSSFSVTTYNGMAYGTNGTQGTLIDENSSLIIKQTHRNGSYATWYSYGNITLNNNSSLKIINDFDTITSSNYNIYFRNNSSFTLNNPKEVVLYNKAANIIYTDKEMSFNFNFKRLNLFNNIININDNISLSTLPTYSWYKETEYSIINGTFTNVKTTINTNNFTEEELESLPNLTNFIFNNKRIMSIGAFSLNINALSDKDTSLTGYTLPYASILISYNDTNSVVESDSNGKFTYTYDTPLDIGTTLIFNAKKQNDLIYQTESITIVHSGEITLESAPSTIKFSLNKIMDNPLLCKRETETIIKVLDTRLNKTKWKLIATIDHNLQNSNNKILEDSLVFKENDNITVLSNTDTIVYEPEELNEITNITWNDDEGILLQIKEYIEINTIYEATITWKIEE